MKSLQNFLKADLESLNAHILSITKETRIPLITTVAEHLLQAGGKRLRPLLTCLAARACGIQNTQRMIRLAACVEFIHTATLLHDDVVDQSNERRHQPSANALWGNSTSILVGDFLFSRSFELMVEEQSLEVFRILSQTASKISEGELHQLSKIGQTNLKTTDYLDIIGAKTASLFAAACELGALAAEASAAQREAFKIFGYNLGLLFQISDDWLDFGLEGESLGKESGLDLQEGKMTLPLILAYNLADAEQKRFIETCIGQPDLSEENLSKVRSILKQYAIQEQVEQFAHPFYENALGSIQPLMDSAEKELLHDLVPFALYR